MPRNKRYDFGGACHLVMPVNHAWAEAKGHGLASSPTSATLPPRSVDRGEREEVRFLTANHANHANRPGAIAANPNPAVCATAGAHPTTRLESR